MKGCEDIGPWAGRPRAQMLKSDGSSGRRGTAPAGFRHPRGFSALLRRVKVYGTREFSHPA